MFDKIVQLTNSFTHSLTPWSRILFEANSSTGSKEICPILTNLKGYYPGHRTWLLVCVVNEMNAIHALTSSFVKIHFNSTLPSVPRSLNWPLSLRFFPPNKRQNCSPSQRFFNPFCNMLHFYGEALLAPHPLHKLEDHPLCKQPVVFFLISDSYQALCLVGSIYRMR